MLDPSPTNRVTPEEALKDPYFESDVDDNDEIPEEECLIKKNLKRISSMQIKNMDTINSSRRSFSIMDQSLTSGAYNEYWKSNVKDSCLSFEFGQHLPSQ